MSAQFEPATAVTGHRSAERTFLTKQRTQGKTIIQVA
jgi:hypothetical protein